MKMKNQNQFYFESACNDLRLPVTSTSLCCEMTNKNSIGGFIYPLTIAVSDVNPSDLKKQSGIKDKLMERGIHVRDGNHLMPRIM